MSRADTGGQAVGREWTARATLQYQERRKQVVNKQLQGGTDVRLH